MLLTANEIQMNCVPQRMGSWNHPNFSYLNLQLSELPKNDIHRDILLCIKWKVLRFVYKRRDTGGRGRKAEEEERRRKGGRERREYQACVCEDVG